MIDIILLHLFWLSFVFIGYAEIDWLSKTKYKKIKKSLDGLHNISKFLIYFCTGFTSFIVVILPMYVFELNLIVLQIAYIAALALTLVFVFRSAKGLQVSVSSLAQFIRDRKGPAIIFLVVSGLLVLDTLVTPLDAKIISGDNLFELSRITLFRYEQFGLKDAFFGDSGIPVSIYSANIYHAFHALIGSMLERPAYWTWLYSHAFIKLISWLSIFAVVGEFLKKRGNYYWAYACLLMLPILFSGRFSFVQMHNSITIAWTCIFILGTILWLRYKRVWLIAVGAFLLATSHPLNAVVLAGFLVLLGLILLFARSIQKQQLLQLLPVIIVLLLPILVYFYYPSGITSPGFEDSWGFGPEVVIQKIAGVSLNTKTFFLKLSYLLVYGILAGILLLLNKVKPKATYLYAILVLVFVTSFFIFNPTISALIGFIYILYLNKEPKMRILAGLIVLFPFFIAYNPFLLTMLDSKVPLWVFSRFFEMNILVFVLPIIAWLWFIDYLAGQSKVKKLKQSSTIISMVTFIIALIIFPTSITVKDFNINRNLDTKLAEIIGTYETLEKFRYEISGKTAFSNNVEIMSLVPSYINANVFLFFNEANVHPNVHYPERKACTEALKEDLLPEDIATSNIDVIIADESDEDFLSKANSRENLEFIKSQGEYSLFVVDKSKTYQTENSVCEIPETIKS